jgi:hypothetical protein
MTKQSKREQADANVVNVWPTIVRSYSEYPRVCRLLTACLIAEGFSWDNEVGQWLNLETGERGRMAWTPDATEAWLSHPNDQKELTGLHITLSSGEGPRAAARQAASEEAHS